MRYLDKKKLLKTAYANRGMSLEDDINKANDFYILNDIALIYKKPTPINVVSTKYQNNKLLINSAYFEKQSTLDYNGIYKSKYIEFEAKETTNKTSFPLSNIHPHQILHIKKVIEHGGISFLIIKMNTINYLLTGEDFLEFLTNNSRKSIPYDYIKEKGFEIEIKYQPRLDYIKVIDQVYFKGGQK